MDKKKRHHVFSVIYALDFFLVMIFAAAGVSFLIDGEGFKVAWAPLVLAAFFAIAIFWAVGHIRQSTHRIGWYVYIALLAALYVYLVIPKG
ncbi:MAG: hypothetical protein J6I46_14125 [Ruminococcus sp.]|nr:hypothetical protein [Ruminococcus sp.]